MDSELIGQVAIAALGSISAAVPILGKRSSRKNVRVNLAQDVAMLKDLPESSRAKTLLTSHIERQIELISTVDERRRDPTGIGLALGFIAIATLGGIGAIQKGGGWLWLLVPVVLMFLLGSVGLSQDATKHKRDDKGRPIKTS